MGARSRSRSWTRGSERQAAFLRSAPQVDRTHVRTQPGGTRRKRTWCPGQEPSFRSPPPPAGSVGSGCYSPPSVPELVPAYLTLTRRSSTRPGTEGGSRSRAGPPSPPPSRPGRRQRSSSAAVDDEAGQPPASVHRSVRPVLVRQALWWCGLLARWQRAGNGPPARLPLLAGTASPSIASRRDPGGGEDRWCLLSLARAAVASHAPGFLGVPWRAEQGSGDLPHSARNPTLVEILPERRGSPRHNRANSSHIRDALGHNRVRVGSTTGPLARALGPSR